MKTAAIALTLLSLGACTGTNVGTAPVAAPRIQYQTSPVNGLGIPSTCAGGQPAMQYNCPRAQN